MKTIHRILHVNLPFGEQAIIGANTAVSGVRGVDIGDGKKYRFIAIRNFKTTNKQKGCKMKRLNKKGKIVTHHRKDPHFHQSFDIDLEEVQDSLTTEDGHDIVST